MSFLFLNLPISNQKFHSALKVTEKLVVTFNVYLKTIF